MPSAELSCPITSSARPYIGDESMTRPPSFTNIDKTSSSCLRTSALRATSNALHVPRPITGSFSPEEGMLRVSIVDDSPFACPRAASVCNIRPAVVVPIIFAASRRVTTSTVGRFHETPMNLAQMPYNGYMPLWIAVVLSRYPPRLRWRREQHQVLYLQTKHQHRDRKSVV